MKANLSRFGDFEKRGVWIFLMILQVIQDVGGASESVLAGMVGPHGLLEVQQVTSWSCPQQAEIAYARPCCRTSDLPTALKP